MLTSLAWIFLCGAALGALARRLYLPPLCGMLLAGILLGSYGLQALDGSLLAVSADLRQLALIIILTRAGLSLRVDDLRRVGRPAVLLCFVPALCEIAGVLLLAPPLLGVTTLEAAVLGTVLAAVSPAVIVPRMLRLMDEGLGVRQSIPQMLLAGASVDDVFVIVLFTSCTSLAAGGSASPLALMHIPTAIVLGIAGGWLCGAALGRAFDRWRLRDSMKVVLVISISFLLVALDGRLTGPVGFSGLLAIMGLGVALQRVRPQTAQRLSAKYDRLWVAAELLLFVLVGAAVDPRYAAACGLPAVLLIAGALLVRMAGVFLCLLGTSLRGRERLFCMLAYCPKATVQAAIGAIPLSMGLSCGHTVLTVAVLAILITAPLGAFAIDLTSRRWLRRAED